MNDSSLFLHCAVYSFFHFQFATSLSNFTNITSCKFNFTSQEAIMRPDKNSKCSVDTFRSAIFRIIWMEGKGTMKVMNKLTVMPVNHLWQTAVCTGILITRMHSSRMRTVRCSGRPLRGGVCPGGVCLGGCLPRGICLGGVSARGCLPRGCVCLGVCLPDPPPCGKNDRHVWKHNLSATTDADGNKVDDSVCKLSDQLVLKWLLSCTLRFCTW